MISDHIGLIERYLAELKREQTLSLKKQKLKALKSELTSIKSELNMFELELCYANEKQRETFFVNYNNYESQANNFEKEVAQLEGEMSNRAPDETIQEIDSKDRKEAVDMTQMNRQQLEQHVTGKQDAALDDLDNIIGQLSQGKNIMTEINVEVALQKERLSKASEDIDATYSISKRTKAV